MFLLNRTVICTFRSCISNTISGVLNNILYFFAITLVPYSSNYIKLLLSTCSMLDPLLASVRIGGNKTDIIFAHLEFTS